MAGRNASIQVKIEGDAAFGAARREAKAAIDDIEETADDIKLSAEMDTSSIQQAISLAKTLDGLTAELTIDSDISEIVEAEKLAGIGRLALRRQLVDQYGQQLREDRGARGASDARALRRLLERRAAQDLPEHVRADRAVLSGTDPRSEHVARTALFEATREVFEAAAGRHTDVVFGKVDVEAQPGLAGAFEVRAIPTLMVLRDGVLLAAQPGMMPAAALDELVGRVRQLDMDEIRRELDTQALAKT